MRSWLAWGAPEYVLSRQQWVPRPMAGVFAFFEDPHNLERITPPELHFQILSMEPKVIQPGTLIRYRLRLFGLPFRWRTRIVAWIPGERFEDIQLDGPYILWHHTHGFEEVGGGVLLTDRVRYRLPFGPLGVLMHKLIVRRQVETIFDYRAKQVAEMMSEGVLYLSPP